MQTRRMDSTVDGLPRNYLNINELDVGFVNIDFLQTCKYCHLCLDWQIGWLVLISAS